VDSVFTLFTSNAPLRTGTKPLPPGLRLMRENRRDRTYGARAGSDGHVRRRGAGRGGAGPAGASARTARSDRAFVAGALSLARPAASGRGRAVLELWAARHSGSRLAAGAGSSRRTSPHPRRDRGRQPRLCPHAARCGRAAGQSGRSVGWQGLAARTGDCGAGAPDRRTADWHRRRSV